MTDEINNGIEIVVYDKIEDFKNLLVELDKEDYNKSISQITNIFHKIPIENATLILQLRHEIKNRTGIIFRDIDVIIKEWRAEKKREVQESQNNQNINIVTGHTTLNNLSNIPDTETIPFDDNKIIITNDKIYFINNNRPHTICDFKFNVVSKVFDKRKEKELFTFKIGGIEYPSYDINGIIKELGNRIHGGKKGIDVISHLIEVKSKDIPVRKSIYITGWNNGWYTPMDEEKKNFTVIHYSEEQRSTYINCHNMYKKYTIEEKETLKKKLQEFVKLTDMPEAYKSITIGLSLMVPFRLYFLKKFGIFPHLALYGKTTAGKTRWLDFWSTYFIKNRIKHMSGKTASSPTRIEGAMTGGTYAIMIDDYKETNSYNTSQMEMILKDSATGTPLWKRLHRDGIRFRAREVVSSIFTTSQALGDLFLDSALMARTVGLSYDKSIEVNNNWIDLELELLKEKLFSLTYDYTVNWTDKYLNKLIRVIEKIYHNDLKWINPKTADILYPKLLKIYKIVLTGCLLAKKIYGIKLEIKDVWNTLIESRRTVVKEFVSIFLSYCDWARNLDPAKPVPRYLTMQLEYNEKNKVFVFSYPCLRDFNIHYAGYVNERIKFKLATLFERLQDALEFKDLIKLDYMWHNFKNRYAILISPVLIHNGDVEPTEQATNIAHRLSKKEKDEEKPKAGESESEESVEQVELEFNPPELDEDTDIKEWDPALGKTVNFNKDEDLGLLDYELDN